MPRTDETLPWLELLEAGTFSEATLDRTPVNFEVSDLWAKVLRDSERAKGRTWLHALFLGTIALERGDAAEARDLLEASMALRPNVLAARNLATCAPTVAAGKAAYDRAWALWAALPETDAAKAHVGRDLSGEICGWLLGNDQWAALKAFLADLSPDQANKDRALHAAAAVAVRDGDFDAAIPVLRNNCFPTYGSMRGALIQLWFQAQTLKAEKTKGAALSVREKLALRAKFRCDGDHSAGTLDGPCVCGPPNLGYAF